MQLCVGAWVIIVPAALVTLGEWGNSKGTFNKVFQAWVKKLKNVQ